MDTFNPLQKPKVRVLELNKETTLWFFKIIDLDSSSSSGAYRLIHVWISTKVSIKVSIIGDGLRVSIIYTKWTSLCWLREKRWIVRGVGLRGEDTRTVMEHT